MFHALLFFFYAVRAGATVAVSPPEGCAWYLLPEHARELRASPEFISYLQKEPRHQALLGGLSGALDILASTDEQLHILAKLLGSAPGGFGGTTPEPTSAFAAALGPAFNDRAAENYRLIRKYGADEHASAEAISALGYLTRKVARATLVEEIHSNPFSGEDPLRPAITRERAKVILTSPRYRAALLAMLAHAPAQAARQHFLDMAGPGLAAQAHQGPPISAEDALAKVRAGRSGPDAQRYVRDLMIAFALTAKSATFTPGSGAATFQRTRSLQIIANYVARQTGDLNAYLPDLIDVMDYYFFGTPFPLSGAALRGEILAEARRLLVPLKAEFQQAERDRPAPLPLPPAAGSPEPYELRLTDLFPPGSVGTVKIKEASSGPAPAPATHGGPRDIAYERALREFTLAAERPRPLSELRPGVTYEFWFLREESFRLQKVSFSEAALAGLVADETAGRRLLTAMHQGRARDNGQAGIKLVRDHTGPNQTPIYEIKTSGTERGLATHAEGRWNFYRVTNKNHLVHDLHAVATPTD